MKKLVMMMMVVVMMVMGCTAFAQEVEHEHYQMMTVVLAVDYCFDRVICLDMEGNEWEFEGTEDWFEGDFCVFEMCPCNEAGIYDDEIVSTTYVGFMEAGYWGGYYFN